MKIRPFVQLLAIAGSALAFLPLQAQAASCSVNQVTINKIERAGAVCLDSFYPKISGALRG